MNHGPGCNCGVVAAPDLEAWAVATIPADNGNWMVFEPRTGRRICWCTIEDANEIIEMRAAWIEGHKATTGGPA